MSYTPLYKPTFDKNLKIYASLKKQIEKKVIFILDDPYYNTEPLQDKKGYDLRGLRSKKIDRNFRIIFAICEECKQMRLQDKNINICTQTKHKKSRQSQFIETTNKRSISSTQIYIEQPPRLN